MHLHTPGPRTQSQAAQGLHETAQRTTGKAVTAVGSGTVADAGKTTAATETADAPVADLKSVVKPLPHIELAAIADARLRPAEKKRIRMRLMSIRTVGDARDYLGEVAPQLRAQKTALALKGLSRATTRTQRIQQRTMLRKASRPR